jgi:ParB family chromosome partitioning protein
MSVLAAVPTLSPIRVLSLSKIVPSKNEWRKGEANSVADLQESLKTAPMLHPIVVRPVGKKFEIVSGHRRFTAAEKMGQREVEVRVLEADDQMAEKLSLEENLRRRALKNDIVALARLHELNSQIYPQRPGRPGKNGSKKISAMRVTAMQTGDSVRMTRKKVCIANGPEEVRDAYMARKIDINEAEALVTMGRDARTEKLAMLLASPEVRRQFSALDAMKTATNSFEAQRPKGPVRKEALKLLARLEKAIR